MVFEVKHKNTMKSTKMFCGRTVKPLVGVVPILTLGDGKLGWILEISARTLGKTLLRGTKVFLLLKLEPHGCVFSSSLVFAVLFLFRCCEGIKPSDPGGTSLFVFDIVILYNGDYGQHFWWEGLLINLELKHRNKLNKNDAVS